MTNRAYHNLRLAAPLLWGVGVLSALLVVAEGVWELAQGTARPSSAFLATLGDGLDTLAMRLEWVPQLVNSFGATHANNLMLTAILTSVVSCAVAFRKLSLWVRQPGDIIPASRYALQRVRRVIAPSRDGNGGRAWGVVVDADTGSPISFAAVHLLDRGGGTVVRTIAGPDGVYGFPASPASLVAAGEPIRVAAWRSGWVQHPARGSHERIALTSWGAHAEVKRISAMAHAVGTAAFWGQVAVVPIAYSIQPGIVLACALVALPVCAVLHILPGRSAARSSGAPPV
ncbi:MAG: carboxypeptidase regulatory-like domain-containing protein [Candidatus Yanofskybacteria bacterium]|nr:carboxypeptidase regulatory-like domain-containing protein [Candidatus Yanofskybacteria bacterium]